MGCPAELKKGNRVNMKISLHLSPKANVATKSLHGGHRVRFVIRQSFLLHHDHDSQTTRNAGLIYDMSICLHSRFESQMSGFFLQKKEATKGNLLVNFY